MASDDELRRAMEARIAEIEATPHPQLWEEYTQVGEFFTWLGWRPRTQRGRIGRSEIFGEQVGPEGTPLHREEWAAIEEGGSLHIFVALWPADAVVTDALDSDTIVWPASPLSADELAGSEAAPARGGPRVVGGLLLLGIGGLLWLRRRR